MTSHVNSIAQTYARHGTEIAYTEIACKVPSGAAWARSAHGASGPLRLAARGLQAASSTASRINSAPPEARKVSNSYAVAVSDRVICVSSSMSGSVFSPRITPMAPLVVDPPSYLNFHHPVGRCRRESRLGFSAVSEALAGNQNAPRGTTSRVQGFRPSRRPPHTQRRSAPRGTTSRVQGFRPSRRPPHTQRRSAPRGTTSRVQGFRPSRRPPHTQRRSAPRGTTSRVQGFRPSRRPPHTQRRSAPRGTTSRVQGFRPSRRPPHTQRRSAPRGTTSRVQGFRPSRRPPHTQRRSAPRGTTSRVQGFRPSRGLSRGRC